MPDTGSGRRAPLRALLLQVVLVLIIGRWCSAAVRCEVHYESIFLAHLFFLFFSPCWEMEGRNIEYTHCWLSLVKGVFELISNLKFEN